MIKINGLKWAAVSLWTSAALLTGCGGSTWNNTPDVNNSPEVKSSSITVSLPEFSKKVIDLLENVSDKDGDELNVTSVAMIDGSSSLPTGYTYLDNNLTIDATNIDVADFSNLSYDLNVTVSDWKSEVSYILNSVIQDSANDNILTASDIIADSNVTVWNNFDFKIDVSDLDWVSSVYYEVLNDSNTSLLSWYIAESTTQANSYAWNIDTSNIWIGSYKLKITANWYVWWENENSTVIKEHDFNIKAPDTQAPVLSSSNKSFKTTVWNSLNLETVTATDNVDWVISVTQNWTVDFNTIWSYNITYTATDSANNTRSITHTYIVEAVPASWMTIWNFETNEWTWWTKTELISSITGLINNYKSGSNIELETIKWWVRSNEIVIEGNKLVHNSKIDIDPNDTIYTYKFKITEPNGNIVRSDPFNVNIKNFF